MKPIAVGVGVLVAVVALVFLVTGGGAAQVDDTNTSEDPAFGVEVASFMQSSSAAAGGGVDDGIFEAGMERAETTEERQAVVERREARLRERQERLEARRANISTDDPGIADHANAAHVAVGATSLERSANETSRAAAEAGVDTARIEAIRTNASRMSGPEMAGLVRGVGRPSAGLGDGPPGSNGSVGAPSDGNDSTIATNQTNARGSDDDRGVNGDDDEGSNQTDRDATTDE